ncbi:hypothetical protein VPNG_07710 [Cytospora leucostoma]|uniref:Calcineurin-like phosphoesterase domain-containing protein n=1 Tax=Cytospora leucostoma TaxID=1230097 RepID=A0A423W8D1_9PEZI|nr:hypothetical protein VPNG_07710 [Cytospora leucostoma]
MKAVQKRQTDSEQENVAQLWEPSAPSHHDRLKPQRGFLIRKQKETRVSEGHINTRLLVISDIHANIASPQEAPGDCASADVMICCGDITDNSEIHEYRRVIDMLSKFTAPLKLVVAGNHDGTLDTKGFWDESNWRYKRWPYKRSNESAKIHGTQGEARRLLERAGLTVLDEGHHSFSLANGAELKVYASPATPARASRYRAFQYRKGEKYDFKIDLNVDVAITHGPPKDIRDPDPTGEAYKGCEFLFDSIARARPRLHCFGHNHGGWGASFVEWKDKTGNEQLRTKESMVYREKELLSIEDIDPAPSAKDSWIRGNGDQVKRELAKTRCVPTSHCAADEDFIEKGRHTLFVNASWKGVDKFGSRRHAQWPWLVDIELPEQRDDVNFANTGENLDVQASRIRRESDDPPTKELSDGVGPTNIEQLQRLTRELSTGEADTEPKAPRQTAIGAGNESTEVDRRGSYRFQAPNRKLEAESWRRCTTVAEQPAGRQTGLEAPSRQLESMPMKDAIEYTGPSTPPGLSSGRLSWLPRSGGVNEKYGFLKGKDRNTSGPWRRGPDASCKSSWRTLPL